MIHVYTGCGKGKTTAALGLALRAAGAGLRVYMAQFVKGRNYSELKPIKKIKCITVEQFGRKCFIRKKPEEKDFILAENGIRKIEKMLKAKRYNVIIMDEVNIALHLGLIKKERILKILCCAPKHKEIILTGRYAPKEILKLADLASEIKELKHYYKKGIKARKGIEF